MSTLLYNRLFHKTCYKFFEKNQITIAFCIISTHEMNMNERFNSMIGPILPFYCVTFAVIYLVLTWILTI